MTSRKHKKRAVIAVPVAAVLSAALGAGLMAGTSGDADAAPVRASLGSTTKTVTLVTGDKVMVDAKGRVAGVQAGDGRKGTGFRFKQTSGHTYVLPNDAEPLIAKGLVDQRLFDVTQLMRSHYDDARRSEVPLIVTYDKGTSVPASSLRSSGATVQRDLPSVNGDALRARKSEASSLWETLTRAEGSGKVKKIWLDAKVKATLDKSVPQIGGPAAHAAGYDGKGVKVAVLDTGIDATHPDLKGRLGATKNFSDAPDTIDRVGHGTHVASTIAGSGAASPPGTKYQGVAPGAQLIIGKVLNDDGEGETSDIIAGMQWAVEQGADVVNMSLGGYDDLGIDPLEQAVNDLSASSGTLFVVAAGNEGPSEGTIGSPGSAEAALTVGAVDRKDVIAGFSSQGPTVDSSLKPDITAPGVGIVAAKAAESPDEPVVDGYTSMSGTSMATPHVAGSAALLAQEHPDWNGQQLKAALTASAKPAPHTSSYTQGTGRVDLTKAITQQVTSSPTSLSFGLQNYPHSDDEPVIKDVTYRNAGSKPVTLDLAVEAYGKDGKPAAGGLFSVSPQQVTVPAGGEATATVTADTREGTADGALGGSLTAATADGTTTARTSLGVNREMESYNLTLKHIGRNGEAATGAFTGIHGWHSDVTGYAYDEEDGETTVRLPKGRYTLDVLFPGADSEQTTALLYPKFDLTKDTTLVLDARKTKSVKVTVPDSAAKPTAGVTLFYITDGGEQYTIAYASASLADMRFGQLGAPVPAGEALAQYHGVWTDKKVNYRLAWRRTGYLAGFTQNVKKADLTKINVVVGGPGQTKGKTTSVIASPLVPSGFYNPYPTESKLPLTGTDYVLPNDIKWFYQAAQYGAPDTEGEARWENVLSSAPKSFKAGKEYTLRFNVGVFGPALPSGSLEDGVVRPGVTRVGDTIKAHLPLFNDGSGNLASSDFTKATSSLYADGQKIFANKEPLTEVSHEVPAGRRTYKLVVDVSRSPKQSEVSTRVTATWTFTSAHVSGDAPKRLPLTVVRFTPTLSTASTAKAGTTLTVPFSLQGAATKADSLRKLAFSVSYDDGKTWQKTTAVKGKQQLKLHSPVKPGPVSLRVSLTDADGNTLIQTIYRAYRTGR